MLRTYAFVDGGHIRSGLEEIGVTWDEIDLRKLAAVALQWIDPKWQGERMALSRVFVYDAVSETATATDRVDRWLTRNDEQMDVHVRRGQLILDRRNQPKRQKGVDVQLAVDALRFASSGVLDVALFLAADADFAPLLEAVRDAGPLVAVCCFRGKLSDRLREAADRIGYLPDDAVAWQGWKLPALS